MSQAWLLADNAKALGQYHKLLPRDVELFDGFADDLFTDAVRVYIRGVPRVQASVPSAF